MNLNLPLSDISKCLFNLKLKCRTLLPKRESLTFGVMHTENQPKIGLIYVINLDRQPSRWKNIERELKQVLDFYGEEILNITERYSAIDAFDFQGDPLDDECVNPIYTLGDQLFVEPQPLTLPTKVLLDSPIKMSRPEVAIARSHINVWRQISAGNQEFVLVLEDDIWLRSNFVTRMDQAWSEVHSCIKGESGFDVLYLSYAEVKHGAPKTFISNNIFRPERGLWYLSGYVLSRKGAKKLLNMLPCRGPIDLWINHKFAELDVKAIRQPIIFQRRDGSSTNSYSILPSLSKIGAINSEQAALFHVRPNEKPVFVFGTKSSGLTSLAMALQMLGYRCCNDLQTLPELELEKVLTGNKKRVFDAYVNIGVLEKEIVFLKETYPYAKFIITKREIDTIPRTINDTLKGSDICVVTLEQPNKWKYICQYLRCVPPIASFPKVRDLGQRTLLQKEVEVLDSQRRKDLKWDSSPWVVGKEHNWQGIKTTIKENDTGSSLNTLTIVDNLESINEEIWYARDDTFVDNLALFRPANIDLVSGSGLRFSMKRESLGVRKYSSAALTSCNSYLYGRFEATLKASKVPGVITGVFLHRDSPRQEIDIEIVGNRTDRLLVNVFYNPGTEGTKFDYGYRGAASSIELGFDASEGYHKYAIEWNPNEIRWFVDGVLVHKRGEWNPTPIPHLPMTFHLNLWPTRSYELAGRLLSRRLPTYSFIKSVTIESEML